MTCTHEETEWKDVHIFDDWDTGDPVYERQQVTRSLCKDIDLHRYKCTRCDHIGYYSGVARAFHEDGVTTDIPGLGGLIMSIEQERADFEAWAQNSFELHRHSAGEYSSNFTQTAWAAWQAGRAALQSQDREVIIKALETAQNNLGPRRPFGSADPNSDDYDHDAFMWDYYQRAIDHARRVEGDGE